MHVHQQLGVRQSFSRQLFDGEDKQKKSDFLKQNSVLDLSAASTQEHLVQLERWKIFERPRVNTLAGAGFDPADPSQTNKAVDSVFPDPRQDELLIPEPGKERLRRVPSSANIVGVCHSRERLNPKRPAELCSRRTAKNDWSVVHS